MYSQRGDSEWDELTCGYCFRNFDDTTLFSRFAELSRRALDHVPLEYLPPALITQLRVDALWCASNLAILWRFGRWNRCKLFVSARTDDQLESFPFSPVPRLEPLVRPDDWIRTQKGEGVEILAAHREISDVVGSSITTLELLKERRRLPRYADQLLPTFETVVALAFDLGDFLGVAASKGEGAIRLDQTLGIAECMALMPGWVRARLGAFSGNLEFSGWPAAAIGALEDLVNFDAKYMRWHQSRMREVGQQSPRDLPRELLSQLRHA